MLKLDDDQPVLFDRETGHVQDFIKPDETMHCSGRPVAEVLAELPHLERVTFRQAVQMSDSIARDRYCTGATQITEAKFWEMLEVLPPCRWRTHSVAGRSLEMFHMSERLTGVLAGWYIADRTHTEPTYWALTESVYAKPEAIGAIVAAAREGGAHV